MRTIVAGVFLTAAVIVCGAQSAPRFEVVSIKKIGPEGQAFASSIGFQAGGRFVATNFTALSLIINAFREPNQPVLRTDDVLNVPGWVSAQRFTIEARTGAELAGAQLAMTSPAATALLRALLEDRFKLQAHAETRELPAYVLKLAKSSGAVGPKLHPSPACEAHAPAEPGQRPCGSVAASSGGASGRGVTMSAMAGVLSVGTRPMAIVDETGLTGLYDFEAAWVDTSAGPSAGAAVPDAPSIFTAVQEQLGLKLEADRRLRRVVAVEHIEMPKED